MNGNNYSEDRYPRLVLSMYSNDGKTVEYIGIFGSYSIKDASDVLSNYPDVVPDNCLGITVVTIH